MKKIYLLFLLLLTSLAGMAQSDYLPKVIPPSPTSDAFRQYGGYTPSLSSGKINIPISLYNLQVKELNILFTLSYSTSGINIQDQPYPAGYGWVFSPGLRVSRTILGRSDDQFPVRSLTGNEDVNTQKAAIVGVNEFSHHFLQASDLYDIQNDIFTVHLPNGSYTFMIERSGETYEAVSVGNLLKIEFYMNKAVQQAGHPSSINGLKITDETGIIYKFGMYEDENIINKYVELSLSENSITTWALRQIILPSGDNINFTWKEVRPVSYQIEVSNSIHITDQKEVLCGSEPGYTSTDVGGLVQFTPYTKVLVLDKIEFPLGSVDFAYKADHDPFITNFLVKNKLGNTIKSINFKYGDNYQDAPLLKELTMDGLEYGPKYRFKYNELRYDKNTRALDFWGFYNGKEGNPTLIPEMSIRIYNTTENFVDSYGKGDRSTDPLYMQAYMLTSIEYPTGGYSEFEYEPHKFTDQHPLSTDAFNPAKYIPPLNTGAGLRVSKITDYPSQGGIPVIKKYKYGMTENGLGNILYSPTLDTFVDEYLALSPMPCEGGITSPPFGLRYARELNINALSNYKKYIIFDRPVWYNMVTEYTDDGKVEYYFENNTDYIGQTSPVDLFRSTFISYYSSLFDDGPRLKKKIAYKKENLNYQPLEETITEYKKFGFMDISNYFLLRQIIPGDSSDPDFTFREPGRFPSNPYSRIPYQISVTCHKPESRQVTLYSGGAPLISKEDYIYNPYMQVSQQIKYLNNSKELDTDFKYPYDSQGSVYQSMLDKNILAPVIEKTTTYNDIKSEHVKTSYFSDPIKTNGLILPEKIQTSLSADETLRTDIVFDRYDKQGNILQYTTLGGSKVSYLWGYNGQYPIAEIRNADYSEIVPVLITESSVKSIAEKNEPSLSDWSLIESIRSSLPQAQVTTYTYYPLIGMKTATDPRGQVTKYDYDWEGRLSHVYLTEDGRDKVIKGYRYEMPGYIHLKGGEQTEPKPEPAEPIDPENLTPDPYKKGKASSVLINIGARGEGSYGLTGWNYDTQKVEVSNVITKTYKTIEASEYQWTTENLRLKYGIYGNVNMTWLNLTQADVDKYANEYLNGQKIPLEEFEQIFGTWATLYPTAMMYRNIYWGVPTGPGTFDHTWGLPTKEDIWQLYGQAPRTTGNVYEDIKDFLFASACDNKYNWTQNMFNRRNISGLTLTPLGMRESNQGGAIYGFGQVASLQTIADANIETLSDRDLSGKSGIISNGYSYHLTQARHRRPMTDQELGYKMYIDAASDQILMLPYNQASSLPELAKGLERGIALRYANREHMKVLKKWSEIQAEATEIKSKLAPTNYPAPPVLLPCEKEPEPETTADPYTKGKESAVLINIGAKGDGSYNLAGWNYDTKKVELNNVITKTYKTIEASEYQWTTENLRLKYGNYVNTLMDWANLTQGDVDKYSADYLGGKTIPLDEFEQVYGTWATLYETAMMYRNIYWGVPTGPGTFDHTWGLPTKEDIWQLYGQAPRTSDNLYNDIKDFLFASSSDFNFGWTQGLFKNKNTSGLTLTPLGMRESYNGGAIYGFGQVTSLQTSVRKGIEILSDRDLSTNSGLISNPDSYHFTQARHRRPLTDQELGYKMYIDTANDQVLMLPYDQVSTLPELPKGLERGVALRYANRKAMKVVKKWSEIQAEAAMISSKITKAS